MSDTLTFRNKYLTFILSLKDSIFKADNLNKAFGLAQIYGSFRWLNHDGTYYDDEVEDFLENMLLNSKCYFPPVFTLDNNICLIVSELYSNGGHSSVVLNWMKSFKDDANHHLIITRDVKEVVKKMLVNNQIPHTFCIKKKSALVQEILFKTASAKHIVLHIHPNDIESAIAARILAKAGKKIFFYNHADHVFSYGISSAEVVCELSNYGIELNKRLDRAKSTCFIGIPIKYRTGNDSISFTSNKQLSIKKVLTCGSSYKYSPSDVFFGDFINKMLNTENNIIIMVVGSTGKESWWKDYRKNWDDKVKFLGTLTHNEYMNIMKEADVYVDSFPITGGTAFPEALLNGLMVSGLKNPIQGYSPVDELRVDNIESLVKTVSKILNGDKKTIENINCIRNKVLLTHSLEAFYFRIKKMYSNNFEKITTSVDVNTFWMESNWLNKKMIHLPCFFTGYDLAFFDKLIILYKLKYMFVYMKLNNMIKFLIIILFDIRKYIKNYR